MLDDDRRGGDEARLVLYTFALSHFSEKIRWTLGLAELPFDEVMWTPFFHVLEARKRGRATTVPVLETSGGPVQDSTRILHWLEKHRAPFALLPEASAERDAVLAVEAKFDDVGSQVVRYVYSQALDQTENVVRYWTVESTPRETRVVARLFPVMRWIFRRKLGIGAAKVARAKDTIDRGLSFLEERVSLEKPYFVGDRLTVADVTAAALLAPLACPNEHPIYGSARYRDGLRPLVAPFADRPGLGWVREMYRRHRGTFPRAREIRRKLDAP